MTNEEMLKRFDPLMRILQEEFDRQIQSWTPEQRSNELKVKLLRRRLFRAHLADIMAVAEDVFGDAFCEVHYG